MDLRLSTLTGAPIILLACQPTAQRPMLVQAKLGPAGHQGDTGEELTLVVSERRLRLVTTTRSLTTTTIAVACAAAAAPDDSAAGNKSRAPGFALEHSGLLCSACLLLCCLRSVLRAPRPLSADSDFSEPESAPPQLVEVEILGLLCWCKDFLRGNALPILACDILDIARAG